MAGSEPYRTARALIADVKRQVRLVSCEEASRWLADGDPRPLLVDVREEHEHDLVRIGGSVHISRGTLEMAIEDECPDRDAPILLYCARGDRSALAARSLAELGYRNVASLDGGVHAWREQGFDVVEPSRQGPGSGI